MTRFFYTLFLLGILVAGIKAQKPAKKISLVDSLKRMLEQKIPDSLRARTNFNLAEQLLYADTLQSNIYLEQGRKLIKKKRLSAGDLSLLCGNIGIPQQPR